MIEGDTNAARTTVEQRRCGGGFLYVLFSDDERRRETGLQRQGAGTQHRGREDILSRQLADDRADGARSSGKQVERDRTIERAVPGDRGTGRFVPSSARRMSVLTKRGDREFVGADIL
jgi:hypothetical protein